MSKGSPMAAPFAFRDERIEEACGSGGRSYGVRADRGVRRRQRRPWRVRSREGLPRCGRFLSGVPAARSISSERGRFGGAVPAASAKRRRGRARREARDLDRASRAGGVRCRGLGAGGGCGAGLRDGRAASKAREGGASSGNRASECTEIADLKPSGPARARANFHHLGKRADHRPRFAGRGPPGPRWGFRSAISVQIDHDLAQGPRRFGAPGGARSLLPPSRLRPAACPHRAHDPPPAVLPLSARLRLFSPGGDRCPGAERAASRRRVSAASLRAERAAPCCLAFPVRPRLAASCLALRPPSRPHRCALRACGSRPPACAPAARDPPPSARAPAARDQPPARPPSACAPAVCGRPPVRPRPAACRPLARPPPAVRRLLALCPPAHSWPAAARLHACGPRPPACAPAACGRPLAHPQPAAAGAQAAGRVTALERSRRQIASCNCFGDVPRFGGVADDVRLDSG